MPRAQQVQTIPRIGCRYPATLAAKAATRTIRSRDAAPLARLVARHLRYRRGHGPRERMGTDAVALAGGAGARERGSGQRIERGADPYGRNSLAATEPPQTPRAPDITAP